MLPGRPWPKSQALLSRETRRIKRIGAEVDLVAVVVAITIAIRVIRVSPKGGFIDVGKAVGIAIKARATGCGVCTHRKARGIERVSAGSKLRPVADPVEV